jgi:hypothetical protein
LTDAKPPNWQLFEQLETFALGITCNWRGTNHSAQCIESHKFILQGTPYLSALRKVMVSTAILDMTTVTARLNPPNVPLHLDDRLTHSKCLLDQVISFFGERLEVPAAGVERPGIVPG